MKIPQILAKAARVLAAVGLIVCVIAGCKPAAEPAIAKPPVTGVKPNSMASAANGTGNAYVSAFEDLSPPKGRDPFFPDSHRRDPAPPPVVMVAHKTPVASDLLLKGIVGSATHRLAVINNAILEVGEESPVRVQSGQVHVRCLEIGDDYVIIQVEGEARSQRLEMDKKNY
jgi:hypothetical protein